MSFIEKPIFYSVLSMEFEIIKCTNVGKYMVDPQWNLKRVCQWTLSRDLYEATLLSESFMFFIEKLRFYIVWSMSLKRLENHLK